MAGPLTLRVITPDAVVVDTTAEAVRFPAIDGSMGVLKNHAPMVAALDAGELTWSGPDGAGDMFVAGGFAEVRANTVRIVTEASEPASAIDVARAEAAAERARKRLKHHGTTTSEEQLDLERLQASLRRALMRQKVASQIR